MKKQKEEMRVLQSLQDNFTSMFFEQTFMSRLDWFIYLNKMAPKGGVVFVGDSLTQEFLIRDVYPNRNYHNRGIGGDTTVGLLKRMDESIYQLEPSKVVLLIGTNDFAILHSTPETVTDNIERICRSIKEKLPGTELVLESIYPTISQDYKQIDEEAISQRSNIVIDAANEKLKLIAADMQIEYVDINSSLKDANGQLKKEISRDGLHLNTKGYEIVQCLLQPYLEVD
ncbi:MAG: lysophospholipase [Anaerolineaceae bacterium]|nr:MAG: lysophospholipase [Anaerolineaceae bacterium]